MQANTLKRKNKNKRSLSVGRGGKRGKTSGKGTKGQNARSGRKKRPEIRDIIKRLPKLRGRGKNSNKTIQRKPFIINLDLIEKHFNAGESVSAQTLFQKGVISRNTGKGIKILGKGEVTKKLNFVSCSFSDGARDKILKVGGVIK